MCKDENMTIVHDDEVLSQSSSTCISQPIDNQEKICMYYFLSINYHLTAL